MKADKVGFIMTELEKIERAKMYIDKLANGIDPISDVEMGGDSVLNNVRLSRCFFYVSDILRRVIENGGEVTARNKNTKPKFHITVEELSQISIRDEIIPISVLVNKINACKVEEKFKKLAATNITNWLLKSGFLAEEFLHDGKKKRVPSELGKSIGISSEMRTDQHGEYLIVLYDKNAQQFIVDNLIGMLEE